MWTILSSVAFGAPEGDAWEAARTRILRAEAVDVLLGAPSDPLVDAARTALCTACAPLFDVLPARDAWELDLDAHLSVSAGNRAPDHRDGDEEPGVTTARAALDLRAWHEPLTVHVRPRLGYDLGPHLADADLIGSFGVRTPGFFALVGREPLWQGPAREGGLLVTDHARPLPQFALGGDTRLPGKAHVIGRFGLQGRVGVLPGERSDVQRPAWLLLDARWAPVPWVEAGLARNAIFGGSEDGVARPVDWGQVILPTRPHVEDDPGLALPDTDERAAWDIRLSPPVSRWGGPVDYAEIYVQHGGEDLVGTRLGGSANVYGAEVARDGWYGAGEWAVIEDDLYRWYVGHRVYHDGWTVNGEPVGHPQGGDQRSVSARIGRASLDRYGLELRYLRVHRVLVADRIDDTVVVFPEPEVRDEIGARAAFFRLDGAVIEVDGAVGLVSSADFVPGGDEVQWRLGVDVKLPVERIGRGPTE